MEYVTYKLDDLGAGIDQLSAENKIPEGYSERLVNVDPTPEGYLRKRTGYGSTSGWVPTRAKAVTGLASSQDLCFYLETGIDATSIDLSNTRSAPIIVYGKLDATYGASWDFTSSNSAHYYSTFSPDVKFNFITGTSSNTITGTTHGLGNQVFIGVSQSTNSANTSNSIFLPDQYNVTISSSDVTVDYINGGPSFEGYIYLLSGAASSGAVYSATGVWGGSLTITAATHQLANTNILPVIYETDGTTYKEIPLEITINASGDVTFTATGSAFTAPFTNYLAILRTVPTNQTQYSNIAANATTTVSIGPLETNFIIPVVYEDNGTTRTRVLYDSLVVDASTGYATMTVTNKGGSAALFQICYEYGTIITNKICVTNSAVATGDFTSNSVEITIWGLSHKEIYTSSLDERQGWVTHLDNYRAQAEEHLVVGLGGMFYEVSADTSTYLMPSAYPRLRNRISASTILAPAFGSGGSMRTRGTISYTGDGEQLANVSSISHTSGNSVTYVLSTPSLSTVGTPISTTSDVEDWLTVSGAGNDIHNGTFRITGVTYGANTITLVVTNGSVDSSDYDEVNCGARAGIFSEQVPLINPNDFLPGDILASGGFTDADYLVVLGGSSSILTFGSLREDRSVSANLRLSATRTSAVIPVRDSADTATVYGFIRGDVVNLSNMTRTPQIRYINTNSTTSVTITGDGDFATITLGSGDTTNLTLDQKVILTRAGAYSGEYLVTSIDSLTTFTVSSTLTTSASGYLLGKTIELDEVLEWADSSVDATSLSVPSRWVPIQPPRDSYNTTPTIVNKYLTSNAYTNQSTIRSVISNDNMYFTNYNDEVFKYDGANVYRASLPRWQPQLFTSVITGTGIDINLPSIGTGKVQEYSGAVFKVDIGQESKFVDGQYLVVMEGSTYKGTVQVDGNPWTDLATHGFIRIKGVVDTIGTIGNVSLSLDGRYRYYYRINAYDANDNIIATAATGADDYIVTVTQDCVINHRLVGLPAWDVYDYDRIEVEIYRTKLASLAPFYKLATIEVPFNNYDGYIDYTDANSDDTLTSGDRVMTALLGAELGTGWAEPLRAKYITTADNRLVLGNVRDYPRLTWTMRQTGVSGSPSSSDFSGKTILLRSDSADTGTSTNNTTRMKFEAVTSGSINISSIAYISGNTYRVTAASGTYAVGNWVYLFRDSAPSVLSFAGWFQVTSVAGGGSTFDIVSKTGLSWSGATGVNNLAVASSANDIPVWMGVDGNYNTDKVGTVSSLNAGNAIVFTYIRRLANAINTTQRVCQTSGFTPWILAGGGSEFGGDTLVLTRPRSDTTSFEIVLPSTITGTEYFVNSLKRSAAQEVSSRVQVFPSRLIVSYPKFPEIFNNPAAASADNETTYDINPADGQEITGIIPFFGESSFGASDKGGVLVVFKTNSIYLLDISGNTVDKSKLQKIDSRGIGCTAPYSIAPTQNGIMFATTSGVYRLRMDLTVEYVGRFLERLWQKEINVNALSVMTGHYYPASNQYKLSVPITGETSNSAVLVYNTVREYTADGYKLGSWTLYSAHPTTGWVNNTYGAFFGSTGGDVLAVFKSTDEKPYRDSGEAIEATATLRSLDFTDSARRKAVGWVIVDYRTADTLVSDDTRLFSSIDNKDQFEEADVATVREYDTTDDGLGSTGKVKVRSIKYSINRRKGLYFQLQFSNLVIDSEMEIAGVTLRVAGLSDRGITQASNS